MATQIDEGVDVVGVEPHALSHRSDQGQPLLGVVARQSLADVVQQRADQQQVGSHDPSRERSSLDGHLDQVSIDGEAMDGVALRQCAQPLPPR